MYINLNGEYYLSNELSILHSNRAFRYGDSLFETIRVISGRPLFLPLHFSRLKHGMQILQYEPTPGFTFSLIAQQIEDLLHKNNITAGGRVRLTVFRKGEKSMYTPETNAKNYLIEAEPLQENFYQLNERGWYVDLYQEDTKKKSPFCAIKTGSSLFYVLAGLYKKQKQLDDVIILNENYRLCEALASNIFLYRNRTLYTPSQEELPVNGIMRSVIMEVARSNKISVVEGAFHPTSLLQADEVFLTNVIKGITWVAGYRQKRYYHHFASEMINWINELIREDIEKS